MLLYEAIQAAGLSIAKTARLAGVNRYTLQRIAQGRFYPSLSTAAKLVEVLGVELEFRRVTPGKSEAMRCYSPITQN